MRYFKLVEVVDKDTELMFAGGQIAKVAIHCLAAFETLAELDRFLAHAVPGIRRAVEGREKAEAAIRELKDTVVVPASDLIRYAQG